MVTVGDRRCPTFQSTPSGGKATANQRDSTGYAALFQSTPSGGKATGFAQSTEIGFSRVSIHAFRGEGDAPALVAVIRR